MPIPGDHTSIGYVIAHYTSFTVLGDYMHTTHALCMLHVRVLRLGLCPGLREQQDC